MELDLRVCKYLVLAQIASDGGKHLWFGKDDLSNSLSIGPVYRLKGYSVKDSEIIKAINTITRSKKSTGFHFYVKEVDGFRSRAFLVYFNFKLDGKRYQISFHSFNLKLEKFANDKFSTRWDKKSSRESAKVLADYLNMANSEKR